MPRPNPHRTIGAEDRMRANVLRILDEQDRSVAWLARQMVEAGCAVEGTAVWKSLKQGRRIAVDEALAISDVLGVRLTELL